MPTAGTCVWCFLGFSYHEIRFSVQSRRNKPTPNVHQQELKYKQKLSNSFYIAIDFKQENVANKL